MRVTALLVDFDGIDQALREACLPVAPALLAQNLRRSARLLTGEMVGFVYGSWANGDQGAADAFRHEGFTVLAPGADASTKRSAFEQQFEQLEADAAPPSAYVLVTHDPSLSSMAQRMLAAHREVRFPGWRA